jgi:hypothetical protein
VREHGRRSRCYRIAFAAKPAPHITTRLRAIVVVQYSKMTLRNDRSGSKAAPPACSAGPANDRIGPKAAVITNEGRTAASCQESTSGSLAERRVGVVSRLTHLPIDLGILHGLVEPIIAVASEQERHDAASRLSGTGVASHRPCAVRDGEI